MNQVFNDKGHLTEYALESIKKGTLAQSDLVKASSHMAECLSCADAFAGSFADWELEEVPSGFADDVMNRLSYNPERNKAEEKKRFLFYSFRVAFAVCASLVIIFSGSLDFYANAVSYTERTRPAGEKIVNYINDINTELKDFSQKILDLEVLLNETEKE